MQVAEAIACESKVCFPDKSPTLSLHEFLVCYERVERGLQRYVRSRKIADSSPKPAVPKEWWTCEALQQLFAWASVLGKTRRSLRVSRGHVAPFVTHHQWIKCCKHTGLLQPMGPISEAAVDIAFIAQVGKGKGKHLTFAAFLQALAHISSDAGVNIIQLVSSRLPDVL